MRASSLAPPEDGGSFYNAENSNPVDSGGRPWTRAASAATTYTVEPARRLQAPDGVSSRAQVAQLAQRDREHREIRRIRGAQLAEDLPEALVQRRVARLPRGDVAGAQRVGGQRAQHR